MLQPLHFLVLSLVSAVLAQFAVKASQSLTPQMKSAVKRAPIQLREEEEPSVHTMESGSDETAELAESENAAVVTEREKLLSDLCLCLVGFATCKVFLLLRKSASNRHPAANRLARSTHAQEAPSHRVPQNCEVEVEEVLLLPFATNKSGASSEDREKLVAATRAVFKQASDSPSPLDQEATSSGLELLDVSPNGLRDLTPNADPLDSTTNAEFSDIPPTAKFPSLLSSKKCWSKRSMHYRKER